MPGSGGALAGAAGPRAGVARGGEPASVERDLSGKKGRGRRGEHGEAHGALESGGGGLEDEDRRAGRSST